MYRIAQSVIWQRCTFMTPMIKHRLNNIEMAHAKSDRVLPPKPKPPSDDDCCDSACELCVKDIYEQELKIWEQECNSILLSQAPKSILSPNTYTKCTIIDKYQLTHDTVIYTFDSKGYILIAPGQHLILREFIDGSAVTRQYTPISVPQATDHSFKIMIKHYSNGLLTSHIKDRWGVGAEVEWRGPHGMFQHQANKYMKYLMLAAGTGIAPMIGVAKAIVADDSDITNIKLLSAYKTYEEILLKSEVKQLLQHWNFTHKVFVSQDGDAESKKNYGENILARKMEIGDIESELINPNSTRVLISGTRQFDSAMLEHCKRLQVPPANIFKF